ncbi:hypothetical protein [Pseudonocardia acaciae]|uniref:hypothetical protein n=1 Tax=Pseudonocardia acaciae TaxID=551276 RepID=UPI000490E71A|nr:hypothetical protein [Pseudonocardia acaciae]
MKSWMTAMAVIGSLLGIAFSLFLGMGDAVFNQGKEGPNAATGFWMALFILALAFLAWVPRRWVRILCALATFGCIWAGLAAVSGFFLPAAAFAAIAAVLMLVMKPEPKAGSVAPTASASG